MKKTILHLTTCALLALSGFAEEAPPRDGPQREAGKKMHRPSFQMVERLLKHIQEQDPEEHARLTTLRENDPQAFRQDWPRAV